MVKSDFKQNIKYNVFISYINVVFAVALAALLRMFSKHHATVHRPNAAVVRHIPVHHLATVTDSFANLHFALCIDTIL